MNSAYSVPGPTAASVVALAGDVTTDLGYDATQAQEATLTAGLLAGAKEATLGVPAVSIAADMVANQLLVAKEATLGTPTGADIATDIANVAANQLRKATWMEAVVTDPTAALAAGVTATNVAVGPIVTAVVATPDIVFFKKIQCATVAQLESVIAQLDFGLTASSPATCRWNLQTAVPVLHGNITGSLFVTAAIVLTGGADVFAYGPGQICAGALNGLSTSDTFYLCLAVTLAAAPDTCVGYVADSSELQITARL